MPDSRTLAQRLIAHAGLALAVVGAATLGGTTARADTPPTRAVPAVVGTVTAQAAPISPFKVLAFGHEATISFTTAEPAEVTVTHKPATMRAAAGPAPATAPAGAFGARPAIVQQITDGQPLPIVRQYTTTHQVKLTGLTSNTAYIVTIVAETQSGQKHTVETQIVTAKQRVRVTLREIHIKDDGDWDPDYVLGDIDNPGEPLWDIALTWAGGSVTACYPLDCWPGKYDAGTIFPRSRSGGSLTWIFAEENFDVMPREFTLDAAVQEEDLIPLASIVECIKNGGCPFSVYLPPRWQVPQGKEWDSTTVRLPADDNGTGFKSELVFTFELFYDNLSYPAPQRNKPSSTWR